MLPHFRKILVAFDGSPASECACEFASKLAKGYGANLVVAYVPPRMTILTGLRRRQLESSIESIARSEILKMVSKLEKEQGVKSTAKILGPMDSVAQSLVDFAEKQEADLLVAGTRGLGAFRRMVLGSVSTALLNLAPSACPVLVVRGGADDKTPPQLRKLLVATDGSKNAYEAIRFATSIASVSGAELTIAHVIYLPPGTFYGGYVPTVAKAYEDLKASGRKILIEATKIAEENGVQTKVRLIDNDHSPVWAITELAEKGKFDLIVMGTRGQGGLRKAFLGSVADGVVHYAKCSVLVTK